MEIARIKELARNVGIIKITQRNNNIIFNFEPEKFCLDIDKLIKTYKEKVKFSPAKEPYITYKIEDINNIIEEIKKFLCFA